MIVVFKKKVDTSSCIYSPASSMFVTVDKGISGFTCHY